MDEAMVLASQLSPELCRLKVGKQLFTSQGPDAVARLQDAGYELFLDLKYHDIPNTVAAAVRAAARLGVWMLSVHALGGARMLSAAREAADCAAVRPLVVAVTLLTSSDEEDLRGLGLSVRAADLSLRLAALAAQSGLDGAVASARDAAELRRARGARFLLVTPGIRASGAEAADDQRRTLGAAAARAAGSDYLVVGRPVTAAADPGDALRRLAASL